jgi:tetratricopeptide (TPR) repeat protein
MLRAFSVLGLVTALAATAACGGAASDLRNAQALYKDARYEEALLWLAELEPKASEMEPSELARFYYLRGIASFRLGQREDALHYLALADALCAEQPDLLPTDWQPVMQRTLQEITPTNASSHARNPLRPDTF